MSISAISLGNLCATKFQILRHNYSALHPRAGVERFRASAFRKQAETHIFDWQITPLPAVTAYIERDFGGIFEREDLEIDPHYPAARNRRFNVGHRHAFHPFGQVTEADIDAQYATARSKIEYLAGKFRRLLNDERGPLLYIVGYAPPADDVAALLTALRKRAPRQDFHIAFIGKTNEATPDLSTFGDCVSQFSVREDSGKTDEFLWEGDDASWDTALRTLANRFPLRASGWSTARALVRDIRVPAPQWMRQPRKLVANCFKS